MDESNVINEVVEAVEVSDVKRLPKTGLVVGASLLAGAGIAVGAKKLASMIKNKVEENKRKGLVPQPKTRRNDVEEDEEFED